MYTFNVFIRCLYVVQDVKFNLNQKVEIIIYYCGIVDLSIFPDGYRPYYYVRSYNFFEICQFFFSCTYYVRCTIDVYAHTISDLEIR